MFTSLERIDQRIPNDLSPQLLRKAHALLDEGNEFGAAIVCREAIRMYLLASCEFYAVTLKKRRRVTNGELLAAVATAGKFLRFERDCVADCLAVCNSICHFQPTKRSVKFVVEISYMFIVDECPWRNLDPRHVAKPKSKHTGFDDDEYDPADWWKRGDA
jgi:hypothetical protein